MGFSNININLVGIGISVKFRRIMGCSSLINVIIGWFRKLIFFIRMLVVFVLGGIFFMKCRFCNIEDLFIIVILYVYKIGISYDW